MTEPGVGSIPAAPPISTPEKPRRIRNDYFPWRRLFIILVGVAIELAVWRWSINYLYSLPPTSVGVFGTLTTSTQFIIGFLVGYFVTGQAYFTNWTNVTTSTIATEVKTFFESKKSKETKSSKA